MVERFGSHLEEDEREALRSDLNEFVRFYAFLSQILTFQDAELERLYLFGRYLKRVLPVDRPDLPREIKDQIDIDAFALRETHAGSLSPDRGKGTLDPRASKAPGHTPEEERERLSAIIQELNDRFGASLTEEDRISLENLEQRLSGDAGLQAAARSNARENVRLTFEQKVKDYFQDMARSNFGLYKRVTDDREFGKRLVDLLFEGFWGEMGAGAAEPR